MGYEKYSFQKYEMILFKDMCLSSGLVGGLLSIDCCTEPTANPH